MKHKNYTLLNCSLTAAEGTELG